ncbi:MAG: hypothetical protein ABFC24_03525 [Methanoregulaceae archaeon]
MEFDLCPAVTLQTGMYNVVVGPPDLVLAALNSDKELQRFLFLYVCGNYSRILTGVHRTANFDVRRAFTAFQLDTILSESYHTVILVEHDPTLYDSPERNMLMAQVTRALRSAAQEAMVILYTPSPDRTIHTLAKGADRVFHLAAPADPVRDGRSFSGRGLRAREPGPRLQTTLEAFNGTNNREQPDGSESPRRPVDTSDKGASEGRPEVWRADRTNGSGTQQRRLLCI